MAEKVTIGNAELWHGDCREVLPLLEGVYPRAAPHIATQLVPIDAQELIESCVPGGSICDPQNVADAIREYMTANTD